MDKRFRPLGLVLAAMLWAVAAPAASAQVAPFCAPDQAPGFAFGFAALSRVLGEAMGDPVECEHANPSNGDALQVTTKGLAFYRKSTNTPTFTNGHEHWASTEWGLLSWTGERIEPPDAVVEAAKRGDPELAAGPLTFTGDAPQRTRTFWLSGGDYTIRWSAAPRQDPCYMGGALRTDGWEVYKAFAIKIITGIPDAGERRVTRLQPGQYHLLVLSRCAWEVTLEPL